MSDPLDSLTTNLLPGTTKESYAPRRIYHPLLPHHMEDLLRYLS